MAKRFSFAHLAAALGGSKAEDQPNPEEKKDDESKAEDQPEEDDEEKDDESKAEDQPEEEEKKTDAKVLAERARCAAIFAAPAAAGNLVLACHLAFETGLSARQAVGLLKSAAPGQGEAPPKGNPRALQQMNASQQPQIGPGGDGGASGADAKLAAQVLSNMAACGLITKEK